MWLRTSADRTAIYNLAAFDVVVAEQDLDTSTWLVQAMYREGSGRVLLAEADDQEAADNIVAHIAELLGAIDLGRGTSA